MIKQSCRQLWHRIRQAPLFNTAATTLLRPFVARGIGYDFVMEHLPYYGEVRLPLPNGDLLRLRSFGDDFILNQIFWRREYEPETFGVFFKLAQASLCTIDIGAHVGIYALAAGYANRQAGVYAFEPVASTFQRLQDNIRQNAQPRVFSFASAVSDKTGTATLFHIESPYILSNPSLRDPGHTEKPLLKVSVPVTTLDQFVVQQRLERVDLIKMDTEGTEVQVLRGMPDTLARHHPDIFCEVLQELGDGPQLEALLKPLGYRFYRLEPSGPVACSKIEGHPRWWNYLFSAKASLPL